MVGINMDMPKCCQECMVSIPFCNIHLCGIQHAICDMPVSWMLHTRPDWCPLKELDAWDDDRK